MNSLALPRYTAAVPTYSRVLPSLNENISVLQPEVRLSST